MGREIRLVDFYIETTNYGILGCQCFAKLEYFPRFNFRKMKSGKVLPLKEVSLSNCNL